MSEHGSGFPVSSPEVGQIIDGIPSYEVAFVVESGFTYRKREPGEFDLPAAVLEEMVAWNKALQRSAASARNIPLGGIEAVK